MKVAIYSRKSIYTSKGDSIENQVEMCKEYILKNIKEISLGDIIIYEDEGFSGKNINRPRFKKMLLEAKREKYRYIVCYRLDRISRNVSDFSRLIEELNLNNIGFICIKEQFDTSTPMGRAMMYIASVFAQLERETIAERVRDNMMLLARTGRWLGGSVPTGFISEQQTNVVVEGKVKTSCNLKVVDSEIEIVKKIYKEFLKCGSLSTVSKCLASEGVKSQKGNYFTPISIKDILSNPVYCVADRQALDYFKNKNCDVCFDKNLCNSYYGIIPYNRRNYRKRGHPRNDRSKWIIAVGKHKGVIRGKDWAKVQDILDENKVIVPTRNNYALFSGFIVCEKCGEKMFAKLNSKDKEGKFYYYICKNKLRYNRVICDCSNLNGPQTDKIVCNYILEHIKEDRNIIKYLKYEKSCFEDDSSSKEISKLDDEISEFQKNKEKYIKYLINLDQDSPMKKEIELYIQNICQKIEDVRFRKDKVIKELKGNHYKKLNLDMIINNFVLFRNSFIKMDINDKKTFLKLILQKLSWDGNNLNIFLYVG